MKVPSHLNIDGVVFPLMAYVHGVRLADSDEGERRGLGALDSVLTVLLLKRSRRDRTTEIASVGSLALKGMRGAVYLTHAGGVPEGRDTPLDPETEEGARRCWTSLSGQSGPESDFYVIMAYPHDTSLALPRHIFKELVERVGALHDDVMAGRLEPCVDDTPVPPFPPEPEPEPYPEDDEPYEEETPEEDVFEDVADPPAATSVLVQKTPVDYGPEPTVQAASDDTLRFLEGWAEELERLDEALEKRLPKGWEKFRNYVAPTIVKRRLLLTELDAYGLLVPELAPELRPRLEALGLKLLVGYLDAGLELARYLASDTRARIVPPSPRPPTARTARVSLDWFRKGPRPTPAGMTPDEWLALCEHYVITRADEEHDYLVEVYTRIRGHNLDYLVLRPERYRRVVLWRAG